MFADHEKVSALPRLRVWVERLDLHYGWVVLVLYSYRGVLVAGHA
jgi:hypothetical protein